MKLNPNSAKSKLVNLDLCIICQHIKDNKGSDKLTSTNDGRQVIIKTSEKLQDGLVVRIDSPNEYDSIKYHVKTCYATYKKRGERYVETSKRKHDEENHYDSPLTSRTKRCKSTTSPEARNKPCVICNHVKCQGDTTRFRIETVDVADLLLKAAYFNEDEVHTRMIFMKEVGDVWANDVMYHKKCMIKYTTQYERDKLLAGKHECQEQTSQIKKNFDELVKNLQIDRNGYVLSDIRDNLNEELKNHGKL